MSYRVATSQVAASARTKLETLFHDGSQQAAAAISGLMQQIPVDMIAKGRGISFFPGSGMRSVGAVFQGGPTQNFHPHALNQVLERGQVRIPKKFADDLIQLDIDHLAAKKPAVEAWGLNALVGLLNENYSRVESKFLVRSVGPEVRGFLSDRFRRIDTAPIIEEFLRSTRELGAVPVGAVLTPTKFALKVMIPHVFEPITNEVLGIGIALHNSDYGDGACWLRIFVMRLLCLNGMFGEDIMRKVHLGGRLGDDLAFSEVTYQLDTKTMVSATRDIVAQALTPEVVEHRMGLIAAAASAEVDADQRINAMQKAARLTKEEAKRVKELYTSADVEMLPPGNTAWRLSNALALFAHDNEPARQLEIEALAGELSGLSVVNSGAVA
jgi:hypothetical protein